VPKSQSGSGVQGGSAASNNNQSTAPGLYLQQGGGGGQNWGIPQGRPTGTVVPIGGGSATKPKAAKGGTSPDPVANNMVSVANNSVNPVHPHASSHAGPLNINQPFQPTGGKVPSGDSGTLLLPEQAQTDEWGLSKPNSEIFSQASKDKPVETSIAQLFPQNIFAEEAAKTRAAMLSSVPGGGTVKLEADVPAAVDMSSLDTNIIDRSRVARFQAKLHKNVGTSKAVTKISDEACVLLSEGIQLHAKSLLDQCSITSRRRRHESLVSSYEQVARALEMGQGVPQTTARSNLALKFGVDARKALRAEEVAFRRQLTERTRAWEMDVLTQYQQDNETIVVTTGRKRAAAAVDDNAPTASETKWKAEEAAEEGGMLTWGQVAQIHFKDKLAQAHHLGPYLKSNRPGGVVNEKSSRKRQKQQQAAVAHIHQIREEEEEARLAAKAASAAAAAPVAVTDSVGGTDAAEGATAAAETASDNTNSSSSSHSNSSVAPMSMSMDPPPARGVGWAAEPCPLGGRSKDQITSDDMKAVLAKYAGVHPKCNYPLHDSSLAGRSFNRSVLFGLDLFPQPSSNSKDGPGRPLAQKR